MIPGSTSGSRALRPNGTLSCRGSRGGIRDLPYRRLEHEQHHSLHGRGCLRRGNRSVADVIGAGTARVSRVVWRRGPGGVLYVVRGSTPACTSSVLALDLATSAWTSRSSTSTPRCSLALAALNGRLYALGGYDDDQKKYLASVESYDPATDTWRAEPEMSHARGSFSAVELSGVLYIAGGNDETNVLSTVEALVPAQ
jgi:hypothetical protein